MSLFVSPELCSERDYVITHSVRSMYVVCSMWYFFAKLITVSTYIDVFPWDLDTMILGWSHTCDLNRPEVKGHLGVNDLWFTFLKKGSYVSHMSCKGFLGCNLTKQSLTKYDVTFCLT